MPAPATAATLNRRHSLWLLPALTGLPRRASAQVSSLNDAINKAGRQRMLSQRMAALYLAASWGVQAETLVPALRQAQAEFVQAHGLLKSAPETTPVIRHALGLAEQQYGFFDSALRRLQPGQPEPRQQADVFATSERILQVMDQATGEYARAGG